MTPGRVVVSGAGGFIGRWSVPPLMEAGFEVHAVLHGPASECPQTLRGATLHRVDLLEPRAAAALLGCVKPSHLLHFAWIATPGLYGTSADNVRWLEASRRLLESFHANGGARAVMAGSCAEYDWSRAGVCDEFVTALADASSAPITPYADCKLAMQRWLADFGRDRGMSTAWGRIFFQFGPHEHEARLVASVISNLLQGRAAPCTHGRQIRSFLHVADVGAAFAALAMDRIEGPVNVGSGDPVRIAQLLEEIGRQIGRPDLIRFGARDAPPSEPAILLPAIGRLRDQVGWRARFTLEEGIANTIDWWRGQLRCQ